MKFTCSVKINSPLNTVVELFENPGNFKKWQDGFVSLEPISGTPGMPGAKSKIIYNTGKHVIELTETIINNNLPDEFSALYEHKHMINTMSNFFISVNDSQTVLETQIIYTKFNGLIPKMMSVLMPGVFKKQTQKWLGNFKIFVENEKDKDK